MGWQILHLATSLVQAAALQGAPAIPVTASPASLVWGDIDGDGFHDALVLEASGLARLLHNEGNGQLADITIWSGLEGIATASLALWQDYDRDGRLDLFVGTSQGAGKLFHNLGEGRFEDVASQTGITHVSDDLAAGWLDYDQDGWADLHVRTAQGDLLYRNLGQGSFESVDLYAPTPVLGGNNVLPGVSMVGNTAAPSAEEVPDTSPESSRSRPSFGIPRSASESPLAPGTSGREELVLGGPTPLGPIAAAPAFCAGSIEDVSASGCLTASSSPLLGSLYPLSNDFFVDSFGRIGMGTSAPGTDVHIKAAAGGDGANLWLQDDEDPSSQFQLRDASPTYASIRKFTEASQSTLDIDAIAEDGVSGSFIRFFRSVNTTGTKAVQFLRGNGLNEGDAQIGIDGINSYFQRNGGKFGIGTSTPVTQLEVAPGVIRASRSGGSSQYLEMNNSGAGGAFLTSMSSEGNKKGVYVSALNDDSGSPLGENFVYFRLGSQSAPQTVMAIRETGNVGIGTTTPSKKLDVNGDIRSDTIELTGADLVEGFDTGTSECPPGSVVVIDRANPGALVTSEAPYDFRVAGVVSGAGGIDHGIKMGQGSPIDGETPVAMAGRVYVNCTTENGPIVPGDRLTSSSTRGHAMKATDKERSDGAVIGKAMTSLDEGTGLVLVLVNLQ